MSGRTGHRLPMVIDEFAIRRSMPSNPSLIEKMLRCSTWHHTTIRPHTTINGLLEEKDAAKDLIPG